MKRYEPTFEPSHGCWLGDDAQILTAPAAPALMTANGSSRRCATLGLIRRILVDHGRGGRVHFFR